jgi:hypothetical protein
MGQKRVMTSEEMGVGVVWNFWSVASYPKMWSRCLLHVDLVKKNQRLKLKGVCVIRPWGRERERMFSLAYYFGKWKQKWIVYSQVLCLNRKTLWVPLGFSSTLRNIRVSLDVVYLLCDKSYSLNPISLN